MFEFIKEKYQSYSLYGSVITSDSRRDSITGEELKDEVALCIDYHGEINQKHFFSIETPYFSMEKKNKKNRVKNMKKIINEFQFEELPCEGALLLSTGSIEILKPPIPYSNSYDDIIVFGNIPIRREVVDSEFDLMDYTTKRHEESTYKCSYCGNLKVDEKNYLIECKNSKYNKSLCGDCAKDIREKCAKIGNNEDIISEIVANRI